MKTLNSSFFKTSLYAAAIFGALTIVSCNQNSDSKDSKEVAEDRNDAKFSKDYKDDADFLVSAAETHLEEIQLGQLAQTKSTMPDVIELGKMMEVEHTKALADLQILAAKKQITIPTTITDDGKDAYSKLNDKTGADFNEKYCDMMVKGHKDAINDFEKASTNAKDADIQSWAQSMLVPLRTHLDHSMACEEKCKQKKS